MSQGGFVSMRAALRAPERVRALVLIDTQSGVEDAGDPARSTTPCTTSGWPTARAPSRRRWRH